MNSHSFNAATINGGVGDTTVRAVVLSYARAIGAVVGRVWRRSPVVGTATVSRAQGRVWRRSPVAGAAQSTSSAGYAIRRWVRVNVIGAASAAAIVTAQAKPVSFVRMPIGGSAMARLTTAGGRVLSRSPGTAVCVAQGSIAPRSRRRSPVLSVARATATLRSSTFRQIPFDELAPPERVFAVQPEQSIFYVVN